ncbi:MAG TPA: serine hydrolase domain-containing protein [Candidatus Eisenbacteria bacterium]|nr:serine hydrolase domain-containing protein [Candidatus Eisenbacteria bacterium]
MSRWLQRFAVAALVLLTPPALAATKPHASVVGPTAARIDSFMVAAADYGMAGTLLVERDGKVLLDKGYGIVDRAKKTHATATTPYLLGSLSKQFTAAAIYKLESQGKLHLTDSLGQWFPDAPVDKRGITIDELVHHTSGLPYLGRGDLYDSVSVDSMVRELFTYPLDFPPGTRYSYSSPGYNLLGVLVARASGRSFNEYLRREIFGPAGMTETGFVDETARWTGSKRTPSYSSVDPDPDPKLYPAALASKVVGAGGVISTAGDLWKWEQALRSGRVLDAATTAKLFAPGVITGPTSSYAGGWQVVQSQRKTTVIMHAGDIGGFNTDMRRMVDEHATIIFLSNTRDAGRGYRDIVPYRVTQILFGPEPTMPPARTHVAESALKRWNGPIPVAPGVTVDAKARGGQVWLTARTQDGMFALAGADSVARAQAPQINRLAETATLPLLSGQTAGLDSIFSPSLVETAHPYFFQLWKAVSDSIGGITEHEVIGSTVSPPNGARSLIRVTGPKGSRVMTLDWLGGKLVQSSPIPDDGLTLRFQPESDETLSRYDLWAGRIVRVARRG